MTPNYYFHKLPVKTTEISHLYEEKIEKVGVLLLPEQWRIMVLVSFFSYLYFPFLYYYSVLLFYYFIIITFISLSSLLYLAPRYSLFFSLPISVAPFPLLLSPYNPHSLYFSSSYSPQIPSPSTQASITTIVRRPPSLTRLRTTTRANGSGQRVRNLQG